MIDVALELSRAIVQGIAATRPGTPPAGAGAAGFAHSFQLGAAPPADVPVDEWADRDRILSRGEAKEYGKWRTSRVPFWREPMQKLSVSDPAREIVIMKGSQLGGTQVLLNFAGYAMAVSPDPMVIYLPRKEDALDIVRVRIMPMVESTPALRQRYLPRGSTSQFLKFLGGSLRVRGAQSPNAFRHISARFAGGDDLDGWPGEVGTEGDPVVLLRKRLLTYQETSKLLLISTPTTHGLSRVQTEFLKGDQRRFFIPCPHCGHMDFITWSGFRDFVGKRDDGHFSIAWQEDRPETAAMRCGKCEKLTDERMKTSMFERGEWRALKPGPGREPSYHLPGFYAPDGWGSWASTAKEWLEARGNPVAQKAIINTVFAETYEDRGQGSDVETLEERIEVFTAGEVPDGVGALVGAVDTQGDRLEVLTVGVGAGEECWPIRHQLLLGDPARPDVWAQLDAYRRQTFRHVSGRELRMQCVVVDSGGHHSDEVYSYCKAREDQWVFAIRGGNIPNKPIVGRPTWNNAYRAKLFTICTDASKELLYSRLAIARPEEGKREPGYLHIPSWMDGESIAQIASEKGIWRYVKGKGYARSWVPTRERNEMLDLLVYAHAALRILLQHRSINLVAAAQAFSKRVEGTSPASPGGQPEGVARRRPFRKRGWMGRLKR